MRSPGSSIATLIISLIALVACAAPAPTAEPQAAFAGKVQARGRELIAPNGKFVWRGITAFRLAHMISNGEEKAAEVWLDRAAARGFNVVRVLSTATVLFDLSPERGRSSLPALFSMTRARGIYVHVVANADTARRSYDWRDHSRKTAEACARADNCILWEGWNEPYHPTQLPIFHNDPDFVEREAATAAAGLDLNWAAGASADDTAERPAGKVIVRHLDRGGDRGLEMVRRMRLLESLSARTGKVVINSEMIGFDEKRGGETGTKQRIIDCAVAREAGVLSRTLGVPTTFHLEAGLRVVPLGPKQMECAAAFLAGVNGRPGR